MPTSNSDFIVKYGLSVGAAANIAGSTTVGGSITIANSITTTDGTSSHSIQGNVVFNANTLIIDREANKVGVAGAPTDDTFKVTGTSNVTIDSRVGRNLSVGGNVAITNVLNVAGAANLTSLQVTGNVSVGALSTNGNITLPSGATVDGVDISELFNSVTNAAVLKVYDVNNVQVFP